MNEGGRQTDIERGGGGRRRRGLSNSSGLKTKNKTKLTLLCLFS